MKLLLRAEILKVIKQSKTYYALGAVFVIELLILITAYYQGSTILDVLLDNLKQSFFFEGTLLNGNLILYIVLNSLWFNLPLILMIITSSMLTDEYKDGTMQTVLLQAVKKWKFITAKYLIAIGFTLFVMAFMMISTCLLAYTAFGKGDLVVYLNTLNFFESADAFKRICWAFACGSMVMIFYSVISVTLAIFLKEATKTWIVAALVLVVTNLLLKIDFGAAFMNILFFPKLVDTWQEFFYYETDWKRVFMNNTVLALYSVLLIFIGTFVFHKRDIE
ncbi:ABC transporter permease [Olivibacter sp. SDN3]|uniref:ABC transporter permease n=1 Tax=Olivibacter sp. SDN3 TaxID=2764720 RepID=UPI0016513EBC|nr:ABC transporter permease [Olivibacter sp. SDN3]QNL49763.1 ABC transporter permease [Olivibacter sp. SDN3]